MFLLGSVILSAVAAHAFNAIAVTGGGDVVMSTCDVESCCWGSCCTNAAVCLICESCC